MASQKTECRAAQGTPNAKHFPADCNQITPPNPDELNPAWFTPPTFDFRKKFPDLVIALAALLAVVGFVVGASFVGPSGAAGAWANLLLWCPQRLRVLGAKLLAFLVSLSALTVVLSAAWTGLFTLVAQLRGTSASMTSGAWQSLLLMEARGLIMVLVAGALGFGLPSLGRHTATALGVAIGLIVVFQFGLGTALSLAKVKFVEAYLVPTWVTAWMKKAAEIKDLNSCDFSAADGCQPAVFTVTWQMAGIALAAAFVIIVGAAFWTIRKRDIT